MSACARSAHHFGRRLLRSSTASSCSLCSTHLLFVPQETSLSSSSSSSTLSSSSLTLKRSSSIMAPIQNMTRSPVAHTRSATAPALSTSLITSPASSAEPTLSSSGSRSTVTQPSFATTAESVVSGSILIPESPASLVHHPANITSSAPLSFHNNRCAEGAKFQTQTAVATFDRYFDSSKCSNDTSKSIDSNSVTQPIDSNESDSSPSSAQTQQHPNLNLKRIYRNNLYNRSSRNDTEMRAPPFKPQKALILTKFSRLEYEQRRMPDCSEDQVKDSVRSSHF